MGEKSINSAIARACKTIEQLQGRLGSRKLWLLRCFHECELAGETAMATATTTTAGHRATAVTRARARQSR